MTITYYPDVEQGSDAWHQMRCGRLTASEMCRIITAKTMKAADNDNCRAHLYELLAQRITGYVEPQYVSDDMLRGCEDEIDACSLYAQHHAPVKPCGFITNSKWGFTIGYSPDALVGDDGLLEAKSRRQRFQVQTIADDAVPADFMIQLQTGLLVSERKWIDFVSYSGGLPMFVQRVEPIPEMQEAIIAAAAAFEARLAEKLMAYRATVTTRKLIPTERKIQEEMVI